MVLYHTVLDCVSSSVIRFSDSSLSLSETVQGWQTHTIYYIFTSDEQNYTTYVCMYVCMYVYDIRSITL